MITASTEVGGRSASVALWQRSTMSALFMRMRAIAMISNPFAMHRNAHRLPITICHLKWVVTIGLGFRIFLNDIRPATTSDIRPFVLVHDTQEVRFTLHQTNWKAMYGENIQGFQRHSIVTTEHILIAEQIREIRRQSVTNPFIRQMCNGLATQFQSEELSRIKHLAVVAVAPSVQAISFVTFGMASSGMQAGCTRLHMSSTATYVARSLCSGFLKNRPLWWERHIGQ